MPTKRVKIAPRRIAIPPAAIDAWLAGDLRALHRALGLAPFQMSPIDVDPDHPPDLTEPATLYAQSWPRAVALLEAAGEPGEQEDA